MSFIVDLFKPAPHQPEHSDPTVVAKKYTDWRIRVFYSIYIGYALYYLTRKGLAFAMPALMNDLHFTKAELGLLTTTLAMSYGISKFVSGLISDRSNPRYFMALGLIGSGIFNIFFGCSSSLFVFILFWGLNGWFQGFGWPACTRLLTHWYSKSERGRWWSLFATSQNVGAGLVPFVAAFFAQMFGWRAAMIFPGVIAIFGGIFLINRLCDTPQSLGLPSIEKFRSDYPPEGIHDQEQELSAKEILYKYVLSNPLLWLLGIGYFFIYLIRQALGDWSVLYLVEVKGYSQLCAGGILFWFEAGGVVGGVVAGWASDRLFGGNRGSVALLFISLSVLAMAAFKYSFVVDPVLDSVLIFAIGFLLYGPLILIGVAAAETTHKKAAGTASGFIGWLAYLGAAMAGYPLGQIAQSFGWDGFFIALIGSAILTTVILVPVWRFSKQPKGAQARASVPTTSDNVERLLKIKAVSQRLSLSRSDLQR